MKQGDTIFRGTFVFVDFLTVKFKFDIVTIESGLSGNKKYMFTFTCGSYSILNPHTSLEDT